MKLACADFTWPLLPHPRVFELIRLLEIEGVDLALFGGRSHIRPEVVRADVPMWAGILQERFERYGLELADFYFQPWHIFDRMAPNHPDPREQEESAALFRDMLELARRLKAPGITMLPGLRFGDESWDASIRRSAEALKWRVDAAAKYGIALSVEGHIGSHVDSPEKLATLVELTPGLQLTLDYTHFTAMGYADAEIEPLLRYARHFHCRGAAKGRLQTPFLESTIDYRRVITRMMEIGYKGYFGLEYVWTNWQDCNRCENTCETIIYRDLARAVIAGQEYTPPVSPT
ncbi:MAG: sugar phosphate isomerase/epimerase [Chloroflexi bacterium]|nr:sugar phosphate isomerase/epimerase [Chloroflexota bacterium]